LHWALYGWRLRPPAQGVKTEGVKIGILNDQSGVYADYGGKYSLEAAKDGRSRISAARCSARRSS